MKNIYTLFLLFLGSPYLWAQCDEAVNIGQPPKLCNNTNYYQLLASPYGGDWSGDLVSSNGIFSPYYAPPGTYKVYYTYTFSQDCIVTDSIDIQVDEGGYADAYSIGAIDCTNPESTATLIAFANDFYYWYGPEEPIEDPSGFDQYVVQKAGTYTLEAFGNSGCLTNVQVEVPFVNETPIQAVQCTDCSQDFSFVQICMEGGPDDAQKYWTKGDTGILTSGSLSVRSPGFYIANAKTDQGCLSKDAIRVEDGRFGIPRGNAGTYGGLGCRDTGALLGAANPGFYVEVNWTTIDGSFVGPTNILRPLIDRAGTYILTISNSFTGCSTSDTTQVNYFDGPPIEAIGGNFACSAPMVQALTDHPNVIAYDWTGPNGFTGSGQALTVTEEGMYIVQATASTFCSTLDTAYVSFTAPPSIVIDTILGSSTNNGQVDYSIIGGTGPFAFQWIKNGVLTSTDSIPESLPAGPILLLITDAEGCTIERHLQIPLLLNAQICNGDSFQLGENFYTETGQYEVWLSTSGNQDSLVILELEVNPTLTTEIQAFICQGESYSFQGIDYDEEGDYSITLETQFGCDSTINLNLEVLPTSTTETQASICQGEVYTFHGQELVVEGQYTASLQNQFGCDSTINLNLEVLPTSTTVIQASICQGEVYAFHGQELVVEGQYTASLQTQFGCDSTINLNLEVLPTSTTETQASICQGEVYTFHGQELAVEGQYTVSLQNQFGCDSTILLNLEVAPTYWIEISESLCSGDSYHYQDAIFTESGQYIIPSSTIAGCDSTIILDLIFEPTETTEIDTIITTGEPFLGVIINQDTVLVDSLLTQYNCDSLVIYSVTADQMVNQIEVSILDAQLKVYPNPVSETLYFNLRLSEAESIQIKIWNVVGHPVASFTPFNTSPKDFWEEQIPVNQLPPGMYLLEVYIGKRSWIKRFIKQK